MEITNKLKAIGRFIIIGIQMILRQKRVLAVLGGCLLQHKKTEYKIHKEIRPMYKLNTHDQKKKQ